jgi:NAD(P)H-dependent flavin oxidoreductase YrpB (nitropropane dioxygenase family)
MEAGGHVRGHVPLAELVPAVRAAVSVPVVAAGGIGNVAAIRSALSLGADAVRVGTRFVATRESYAHPGYIDALVAASSEDSVLTEAFGIGWPDAPHRVLQSAIDAAAAAPDDVVGQTVPAGGTPIPMPRFGVSSPTRDTTGDISAMALYAGRSVGSVDRVMSAAEVVTELSAAFSGPCRQGDCSVDRNVGTSSKVIHGAK